MSWFDEFAKAVGGGEMSRREAIRRAAWGMAGGVAAVCGWGVAASSAPAGPVENACRRSCRIYGGVTAACVQSCAACSYAGNSLCRGTNGGLFCCAGPTCPLNPAASPTICTQI